MFPSNIAEFLIYMRYCATNSNEEDTIPALSSRSCDCSAATKFGSLSLNACDAFKVRRHLIGIIQHHIYYFLLDYDWVVELVCGQCLRA